MTDHIDDPCDDLPDDVTRYLWAKCIIDRTVDPTVKRMIKIATSGGYGRFASGGTIKPGSLTIVGDRGRGEAILPLGRTWQPIICPGCRHPVMDCRCQRPHATRVKSVRP